MELFIDTANIEEIEEIVEWGIVSGVTTNPSLMAKENKNIDEIISRIIKLVDGPINVEVNSTNSRDMLREARRLAKLSPKIVIKLPMVEEGLRLVRVLEKEGIRTNVTLVFSLSQALLAARAGASYISPFVGRLDDIGGDGIKLIEDMAYLLSFHKLDSKIIAASIRNTKHVTDAALAGAHISTLPYKVFKDMLVHPLTETGLEKFIEDWEKSQYNKEC